MPRDPSQGIPAALEFDCPTCGAPMEVIGHFILRGVPADVEHVKVRCIIGHWFTPPTDSLARRSVGCPSSSWSRSLAPGPTR